MRFLSFPLLLFSASTRTTCYGQTNNAGLLQRDDRLSKFVQLLDRAGIPPSVGETIFAPTTDAFNKFRENDVSIWNKYAQQAEWFIHLHDLLLWHFVTEGRFTTDDIFNGQRMFLENSLGNITIEQRFKKLDNVAASAIIDANITTEDGIVHLIDEVIIPPYLGMNIIAQLLDDRSAKFAMTTMANLALHVGLDEQIDMLYEHGLTMLVIPNRRFTRGEGIDVPLLLTDEMRNYTRDFLLCHMILDNYYEAGVFASNEVAETEQFLVTSFLGTHMWITTTANMLRFQSSEVLLADQAARNGIYHVIDDPLKPPFISDFTYFTSITSTWNTEDCHRFFAQTELSSEDIALMFNTTLTFFCPTVEAFTFFNNEDFQRLLEPIWIRHATEFLLNHFSSPAMTRAELVNLAPGAITMLNGATYELRKSGERPRIKNGQEQGRSEYGDLIAVDGYVHMLDSAITPTAVSHSVYDRSRDDPNFSLLVENIDFVDLTDLVDRTLPITFLAPDNTAWRRIVFGTTQGGEIVKRHIFRGLLFLDVIRNATQLTDVNGLTHAVELRGEFNESLWVGGGNVYEGDILARNGILHYIDRVIGEPFAEGTVPPTMSPQPTITPEPTIVIPPSPAPIVRPTGSAPIYLPPIRAPTMQEALDDSNKETPDGSSASSVSAIATILASVTFVVWGMIVY